MRNKLFLFLFFSQLSYGFLPPVNSMLKESLGNRKPYQLLEIVYRHRIHTGGAQPILIEEHIATDPRGLVFSWKQVGTDSTIYGTYERGQYQVGGTSIPTQSNAFLRYLTTYNPDFLRDTLLAEGFINREQLMQYKPTFTPNGDPQLWEVKENYIQHESIYLKRLGPSAATIVVDGSGSKRVYFSRNLTGIERLEWGQGENATSWDFDQFGTLTTPGTFPRRARFLKAGQELIYSELVVHRPAKPKVATDLRQLAKTHRTSPSGDVLQALRRLLSYR